MAMNIVQTAHAMCTALNVVQTSHSFGDVMLLAKASESKQVHFAYMTLWSFLQLGLYLLSILCPLDTCFYMFISFCSPNVWPS